MPPGLKDMSNPYQDVRIIPDKSTYRVCPWNPTYGLCFANFENLDGTPFEMCSRSMLKRACTGLRKNYGIEMRIGIEIEFTLCKKVETTENGITHLSYA